MKYDKFGPVKSYHYDEKRALIPDSEHKGEEADIIKDMPKYSSYKMFEDSFERGRDPELYWLDKYKNDDEETQDPNLKVDIRSLYAHENIDPEKIIKSLYSLHLNSENNPFVQNTLEGFDLEDKEQDEIERLTSYYKHNDNWKNRLIQGDSLLVMNSLLNRENMKGQVQCVYMDPPYGIRYGGNWQIMINKPKMSHESKDSELSGEPDMLKAYRDTWQNGIHSYLSYIRDRLILARELLNESGSCFVQISDDNVHLVRCVMDEVFGSENFVSQIIYKKTSGAGSPGELTAPPSVADYIIWYAKDIVRMKYRKLLLSKGFDDSGADMYKSIELADGSRMSISDWEKKNNTTFVYSKKPKGSKIWRPDNLTSQSGGDIGRFDIEFQGKVYRMKGSNVWKTNKEGIERLKKLNRIVASEKGGLGYVRYLEDFPAMALTNLWTDTTTGGGGKLYVVQSGTKPIQRCILMTTDPGDIVLDPTCGSGTTAYVAEQWGRRWITIDTSRVALNIAKIRLTTALYPYYKTLDNSDNPNLRQGFVYKTIPHITLKSLANNLPPQQEKLYDQPEVDKKKLRVTGPFTVETLQSKDIISPDSIRERNDDYDEEREFRNLIFDNLKSAGIRNGKKNQQVKMYRVEPVDEAYLNAKGYYKDDEGNDHCAYFFIGPKFSSVSKNMVNEAIKAFRFNHLDESEWLGILGFSFDDDVSTEKYGEQSLNYNHFHVDIIRMNDDLLQEGLKKKDNKAASFIIIGEPDISLEKDEEGKYRVKINGMDMYDPIHDNVESRNKDDIAYWEMDKDYTGSLFKVQSVHFCGGKKKEYDPWKKGLTLSKKAFEKNKTENALRMKFSDEMWDKLYSFESEPIDYKKGRLIAVRVVSQFGEEATRILEMK